MQEISTFAQGLLKYWPFFSAVVLFAFVTRFLERKVFSESRQKDHWFFWWGNETLSIQPFLWGTALGILWRDPQGLGWGPMASVGYFWLAAGMSLFFWTLLSGFAKKRGFSYTIAGESLRPKGSYVPRPQSIRPSLRVTVQEPVDQDNIPTPPPEDRGE